MNKTHAVFQMFLLVIFIVPLYFIWSLINSVKMAWFLFETIDEKRLV